MGPSKPAETAATPGASGPAGTTAEPTRSAAAQSRYRHLSEELRCLVCQNQSLADSNADLAADLRQQVYELIDSGRDDEQIKDYLVQRYGEFVLYRPRMSMANGLLWAGPFALLGVGALVWWTVQRRQRGAGAATPGGGTPTATAHAPHPGEPAAGGARVPRPGAAETARAEARERARRLLD